MYRNKKLFYPKLHFTAIELKKNDIKMIVEPLNVPYKDNHIKRNEYTHDCYDVNKDAYLLNLYKKKNSFYENTIDYKDYKKEYYKIHKEYFKNYHKLYYESNREKIKKQSNNYYHNNKEKVEKYNENNNVLRSICYTYNFCRL